GLFYIPALVLFSSLWGFNGFIRALPTADLATALLSLTLFHFMKKEFQFFSVSLSDKAISPE
ncbi:MAG: hypothetical protein WBK58_01790, partial [Dethiobacteria bacterium]